MFRIFKEKGIVGMEKEEIKKLMIEATNFKSSVDALRIMLRDIYHGRKKNNLEQNKEIKEMLMEILTHLHNEDKEIKKILIEELQREKK